MKDVKGKGTLLHLLIKNLALHVVLRICYFVLTLSIFFQRLITAIERRISIQYIHPLNNSKILRNNSSRVN